MVHLKFDWPAGTRVVVEAEWSRLNQTQQRRDSVIINSRYHMNVLEHPRGRLVEIDATATMFSNPGQKATEDYISGRFG